MFATSRQNNEDKILSYCEHSIRKPVLSLQRKFKFKYYEKNHQNCLEVDYIRCGISTQLR
jgi:hypothetical protein